MAAKKGAKLVLAARNEDALRQVVDEIRSKGGQAIYVVADVGREEDVNRIAERAIAEFGGFDTWVNNAGVSIFGRCMEVSIPDMNECLTRTSGELFTAHALPSTISNSARLAVVR